MDVFLSIVSGVIDHPIAYVFVFVFTIGFIIFFHELGHYLVARFFGVHVSKFSIGFGKELFGFDGKSGMRWSFSAIPIGGYIKISGDVDPDNPQIWDEKLNKARLMTSKELEGAYCTRSVWQRGLIVLAGPAANMVLGFFVLFMLFSVVGQISGRPVITAVGQSGAAFRADLKPGDQILSINGDEVVRMRDVTLKTRGQVGVPFDLEILRNGKVVDVTIASEQVTYRDNFSIERSHGRVGMSHMKGMKYEDILEVNGVVVENNPELARSLLSKQLGEETYVKVKIGSLRDVFLIVPEIERNHDLLDPKSEHFDVVWIGAEEEPYYYKLTAYKAFSESVRYSGKFFSDAWSMVVVLVTGQYEKQALGGVASIGKAAGDAAQQGLYAYFIFLAVFSYQIAFINLLPIPVLDGGHLVFLSYEAMVGRPLSRKIQDGALMFGLVFLFGIMIIANVQDLLQLAQ